MSSDSDCRNLLDYKVWVDSLQVYAGQNTGSQKFPVKLGSIYTFDVDTGLYSSASGAQSSSGSGTCSNALKEVYYTVELVKEGGSGSALTENEIYYISAITADVVIQNKVTKVDSDSKIGIISQSYGIQFTTGTDS